MSVRYPNNTNFILDVTNVPSQSHRPYLEYPSHSSQNNSEYVYVNKAFNGSLNSVTSNRLYDPPTTVIREQYWACSKWSFAQRTLALAVGVLIGTVVGLVVLLVLRREDNNIPSLLNSPFSTN
ncbi:unnamed protein product [Euphydryas editha]|uniref:Uncharacterized protein n=1 Tax=Euphydryas editha TaxID=104508 RepID=A0AAU9V5T8_EUPED|nr:unnamed protein product [Euphydryas editha]